MKVEVRKYKYYKNLTDWDLALIPQINIGYYKKYLEPVNLVIRVSFRIFLWSFVIDFIREKFDDIIDEDNADINAGGLLIKGL
jgi:hypothetical protein